MNAAERLGIEQRVCAQKVKLGRATAMRIAQAQRDAGEHVSAYRCIFATELGGHWHIGHGPTMLTLERLAEVLRARSSGLPVPDSNGLEPPESGHEHDRRRVLQNRSGAAG